MKTLFLLASLALLRSARSATSDSSKYVQTSTATQSSTASQTSTAAPTTHTVTVGVNGFTFSPSSLTANVGDTILYTFYPANHSVARAEYGLPCIPYENTGPGKEGFWSGFRPVEKASDTLPTFSIKINDTNPLFFYCASPQACLPDGMIGVINPNTTQNFENQLLFVRNATIQLAPGEQNPTEGGSKPSSTPSSSSSGLGGGAIAGIVVGAVAVIALAAAAFYLCGRNRTLASVLRYSHPPSRPQHTDNIPPIPYHQSPTAPAPYSPGFSTQKPAYSSSPNPHESWLTTSTAVPNRTQSPEMTSPGMMSPQHFSQAYTGYNPLENPANASYGGQLSPGQPWSPGGFQQAHYSQVPQQHQEMATGREEQSPGMHRETASYDMVHQAPVELDARSAVPETPGAAPPQYVSSRFSFREGQDAPPGVEKVLRD